MAVSILPTSNLSCWLWQSIQIRLACSEFSGHDPLTEPSWSLGMIGSFQMALKVRKVKRMVAKLHHKHPPSLASVGVKLKCSVCYSKQGIPSTKSECLLRMLNPVPALNSGFQQEERTQTNTYHACQAQNCPPYSQPGRRFALEN